MTEKREREELESTGPAKRLAVWEREKEFMKPTGWVGKGSHRDADTRQKQVWRQEWR